MKKPLEVQRNKCWGLLESMFNVKFTLSPFSERVFLMAVLLVALFVLSVTTPEGWLDTPVIVGLFLSIYWNSMGVGMFSSRGGFMLHMSSFIAATVIYHFLMMF